MLNPVEQVLRGRTSVYCRDEGYKDARTTVRSRVIKKEGVGMQVPGYESVENSEEIVYRRGKVDLPG